MRAVLLIGLRGAGKTTTGRSLAAAMGRPFADGDDLTLARLGAASVREAWETVGEPAFRRAELAALRELLDRTPGVVAALGGGAAMTAGFTDVVRGRALILYLAAEPALLRGRLAAEDPNRPSLTGASAGGEMELIHAQRDPVYRGLADVVVDASGTREAALEAAILAAQRSL